MVVRCRHLLTLLAVVLTLGLASSPAFAAEPPPKPRLAVLVVFDQMRGDYLIRWEELFGADGFRRLQKDGAWFQNCHYPYAPTVTAAGHASLATGSIPRKHGIIDNEWFDREADNLVYCVASDRYPRVPPDSDRKNKGASPERLLLPTLGDALKDATGGKGRVVSLSGKDRSAILMAGKHADACYWLDSDLFVTSTFYREELHPWVADFNRAHLIDQWFGKDWIRLRPDLAYERYSGPDDVVGEGKGIEQGRTFPHPMTGGLDKPGKAYYRAVYTSPFGNELILELAKRAIDAEGLGSREVPDLLCVSFSCNDPIGHVWGPDSQEVLDVTLRSDLLVKQLLAYLDEKVGKGRYVLVLSADHGVCPIPEVSRSKGREAERIAPGRFLSLAESFLDSAYGKNKEGATWLLAPQPLEASLYPWIYFNRKTLRDRGLEPAAVERALADWVSRYPGMQSAYTRTQLLQGLPKDDPLGQKVYRSFHPERAGDVAVVVKPNYLFTTLLTGTGHSTAHPYDTHVPLLVYGPGVKAGVRTDLVTPQAATAILAQSLGIKPPAGAEAPVPEKLFNAP